MSDIKKLVEDFYVDWLNADPEVDLTFYASKADGDSVFPLGVVRVPEAQEIIPGSGTFRMEEVQVLIITSIDDSTSAEHSDLVEAVRRSINRSPQEAFNTGETLEFLGRSSASHIEGTSEDQEKFADIIQFSAGARVRS